jgi:hypothetical protein
LQLYFPQFISQLTAMFPAADAELRLLDATENVTMEAL